MKVLLLVAVMFMFTSCTFLKDTGEKLCEVHHTAAIAIDSAGSYLGGPGNLVADIVNVGLEAFCKVLKAILSVPADIADGPGGSNEGTAEHKNHE